MKLPKKLKFLQSIRFWKLVTCGVLQALVAVSVIEQSIAIALQGVLLGSVAIKTVDRFGENA